MNILQAAAQDFRGTIWPILAPIAGVGGELRSVELDQTKIASELDREAGIDHYIYSRGRPLVGIAARVQWKERGGSTAWWGKPWNSFTQRVVTGNGQDWTEYAKRIAAFRTDGLLPQWIVQAYLERPGGPVQSVGLATCRAVYGYITRCLDAGRVFEQRVNPQDGSEFVFVEFREVECWQWYGGRRAWRPADDANKALSLLG